MSNRELKILRRKLQEKLNELNQGSGQTRFLGWQHSADTVEDAQAEVALDLAVLAINKDWETRNAVETALERMEIGSYGICESCEQEISPKRLQAVPWATRCAPCQSYLEAADDEEAAYRSAA